MGTRQRQPICSARACPTRGGSSTRMQPSDVPYFSQWETADMTSQVLAEGPLALLRDPLWRNSGAETIEEYARWAVNVCGMACLKMILAARGEFHPILSLARACTDYGGYV